MSTAIETPTGLFHEAVNAIRSLREENAALKKEVEDLKAHIEDIQHDFAATLAHCDSHHVEGYEL